MSMDTLKEGPISKNGAVEYPHGKFVEHLSWKRTSSNAIKSIKKIIHYFVLITE